MATVWSALAGNTTEQINKSHLTTALAGYALKTDIPSLATLSWSGYSSGSYNGSTDASISIPNNTNQLTNGAGFITSSALASYIQHIEVDTDDLTGRSGSFFFGGREALASGYDYVGIQVGDNLDKWQISALDTGLKWRQNDNGGTNTNWGTWRTILDSTNWNSYITLSSIGADAKYLPLAGGVMTGNISFKGSGSTYQMIKFKSSTDAYGHGLVLGGGGLVAIGGGESQDVMAAQSDGSTERMMIGNDGEIEIYSNLQSGWDSRHSMIFNTNGMLTMDGGQSKAYQLFVKEGSDTSNYWHKLGTFVTAGYRFNLVINIYSGDGYNGEARQNSYAHIIIKDGFQSTPSVTNCLGITCERYGNASQIQIRVNVTNRPNRASATGDVWVLLPWNYANGNYTIEGDFASWNHNSSTSGDTTTPPTHNQLEVMYLDNAYLTSNVASATKLQTPRTLWGQSFDGTDNVNGIITCTTLAIATSYTDVWTDSNGNKHPWYGYDHRYPNTGVFSTTISDYFGLTLKTGSGYICMQQNGNVGIGTTSSSYKLHVAGVIYSTTGIFSDGYVSALGQNTSSDIRKKDIKKNFVLSVDEIASAPSVKYLWKDDKDKGLQVGSIAQYWQNVLPEAVHEGNDGYLTMQYGVIALLASISTARKVQDHERRIKELEKECERLRTEVEQLRTN